MKYEALDVETLTIGGVLKPFSVAISHNNKIIYFQNDIKNIDDDSVALYILHNCLISRIYYVHNLTFEIFVLLKSFINLKVKIEWLCVKRVVYSLKLTFNGKTIRFRCSYRLTLLPLHQIGLALVNQKKLIFPYKILNSDFKEIIKLVEGDFNSKDEYTAFLEDNNIIINAFKLLKAYCINDVYITKLVVTEFWLKLGEVGILNNGKMLTAASLSIKNFFSYKTLVEKRVSQNIDDLVRGAYLGGRCEVFGNPIKGNKILHFDFKAMYGQCMKESLPVGGYFLETSKIKDFSRAGFYYIKYVQNHKTLPVLPVKEDKLFFKNGYFEGLYWFEEINLFLEEGGVVLEISYAVLAKLYAPEMKFFIEINEKLREQGGVLKQIGKNNINTLYGRLGINRMTEVQEIVFGTVHNNTNTIININSGVSIITRLKKTSNESNVAIAAAVTSKARIKLYRGFLSVIKEGGRLLYCDTDSIIAEFPSTASVENRDLGGIRFDTSNPTTEVIDAVFCLPKTYALKFKTTQEVIKLKGLLENSVNFNKLKWLFFNGKTLYTPFTYFNKRTWNISIEYINKSTHIQSYDKRVWSDNKITTTPLGRI